ncbi:MAG: site-specific integrase [Antarcticimicrobium sp.]|nr:site-specific integrase [Antarcticimicrobium sp.]
MPEVVEGYPDRLIPKDDDAAKELKKRTLTADKSSEYLFPSRNGRPIRDIKRPWGWLLKEAGLEDFRLHDLRHSHASILVSQGHSLELIGHLLGHTQAQTTKRYAHLTQDPQRRALAGLDAVISAARSQPDTE